MFLFIQIYIFTLLTGFLNIFIKGNELYIPYSDYKSPSINSIYGTGNRTLDIIYRENCARLCGEKTYSDEHCCEGNTLEEEKCQSFKRCQEILDNFQHYVIGIALISYITLMFITMIIVFIVYYVKTNDNNYKCINAVASSVIVLFAATIIPIAILQFYCWYKVITIEKFFGANFDKCFNISKSLQSVDEIDNRIPYQERDNNNNFPEKPPSNLDINVNNQGTSQRSGNAMIGEQNQTN